MRQNQKAIIRIIPEEIQNVDERCLGYRESILNTIADILEYERQHRVQGTNIQQKIDDKINATGRYLADRMSQPAESA
jgi:hypothetical protein